VKVWFFPKFSSTAPPFSPNALEMVGVPTTGMGLTSMPRFSSANPVKAMLYCGEALVNKWLELIIGEDVGPILLDPSRTNSPT
jgi:hypothetical protein